MEKRELRKHYLALRAAVTERQKKDAAICRNLRELACCQSADALALYVTDGKEPDLKELFLWKRTFLPRYVEEMKKYELVGIENPETDLVPGKYGLLEPRPELPAAPADYVQQHIVFVTPAVACTRRGVRLGRGGGFYDRMLETAGLQAVGVVYDCQLADDLPAEPHDKPLDFIVTESGVRKCMSSENEMKKEKK
jgi:5-formyltetrahydrofolate cyclo-ligase